MSDETTKGRRAFSVAVYPRHQGRVLLIKHKRLGVWLPPGGECEPGETPLEAARRELREETGLVGSFAELSAIDGTPAGLIGYEEHPAGSKGQHLNFVFVADVTTDVVAPNDEFSEWRWVTYDEGPWTETPPNVGQLARVALLAQPPLEAVARAWLEGWNARGLDDIMALYAGDATHTSPKLVELGHAAGRVEGKAAIRDYFGRALEKSPGMRFDLLSLCADSERVWLEYLRVLPGAATLRVAELLEVTGGLIRASRVFHG